MEAATRGPIIRVVSVVLSPEVKVVREARVQLKLYVVQTLGIRAVVADRVSGIFSSTIFRQM
ncbi:hypothetical protein HAX54_010627, partial [Datura stramonium]|nr:hypothetical protein [Datura stramonium]